MSATLWILAGLGIWAACGIVLTKIAVFVEDLALAWIFRRARRG